MHRFEFSNNHNGKLFNDIFGDIRLDGKYTTGDTAEIIYRGLEMGTANIEHIRRFTFSRLSEAASLLNCGQPVYYQAALLNRYYNGGKVLPPDTLLAQIIFKYEQIHLENHMQLMKDYLENKTQKA